MRPPLARTWPADPTAAASIRRSVLRYAHGAGMRAPALHGVALAVTEAANNASIHAFGNGHEAGHITVEAAVDDGHLHVVIRDDGRGMHPRTDSPGMGAGLQIIAHLVERLRIEDAPDGGTQLSMAFLMR
jgi:serine/threonine-protein kinase RsbW